MDEKTRARSKKSEETEKRILKAYSRGATHAEAAERMGKISDSLHTKTRANLVKSGRLVDLHDGKHGPGPHRWMPSNEIPPPLRSNEINGEPVINAIQHQNEFGLQAERFKRENRIAFDMANDLCSHATRIISHIADKDNWKKRSQIKRICNKEILPILDRIRIIKELTEYDLPDPASTNDWITPINWYGSLGRKIDIRGTISIPAPGTKYHWIGDRYLVNVPPDSPTYDGYTRPTLIQWLRYFTHLIRALRLQIEAIPNADSVIDYKRWLEETQLMNNSMAEVLTILRSGEQPS